MDLLFVLSLSITLFHQRHSFHLCVNRARKLGKSMHWILCATFPRHSERSQQRILKFLEEQMMKRGDLQLCTISSNAWMASADYLQHCSRSSYNFVIRFNNRTEWGIVSFQVMDFSESPYYISAYALYIRAYLPSVSRSFASWWSWYHPWGGSLSLVQSESYTGSFTLCLSPLTMELVVSASLPSDHGTLSRTL